MAPRKTIKKKAAPKKRQTKGVHVDGRRTIVIGKKKKNDALMPLRLPKQLIEDLKHLADSNGEIRIGEEAFTSALSDFRVDGESCVAHDVLATMPGDLEMDRINAMHVRDEQMKADNVMTQAQDIIYGDREKTYGRPELNLESIAQLWKVYLQRKGVVQGDPTEITINDVCQMMVLLKTARLINQPDHHDSQVDQIGYIGLQERCRA